MYKPVVTERQFSWVLFLQVCTLQVLNDLDDGMIESRSTITRHFVALEITPSCIERILWCSVFASSWNFWIGKVAWTRWRIISVFAMFQTERIRWLFAVNRTRIMKIIAHETRQKIDRSRSGMHRRDRSTWFRFGEHHGSRSNEKWLKNETAMFSSIDIDRLYVRKSNSVFCRYSLSFPSVINAGALCKLLFLCFFCC